MGGSPDVWTSVSRILMAMLVGKFCRLSKPLETAKFGEVALSEGLKEYCCT